MAQTLLSIVIPIKNEESILWDNACKLAILFDQLIGKQQWKFILVNNNSTDNSQLIIDKITATWSKSKSLFEMQKGYSATLRKGLSQVDTPYALVIDTEQWDIPFIVWAWKHRDEYDLSLGSKRTDDSINQQPFYRWLLTWGLNTLLRLLFNFTGSDTHGQKLICMRNMQDIIKNCLMFQSLYDTEIVLRASRHGLNIAEAAVAHSETRPPRNRMLQKIVWNLIGLIKLHRIMRRIPCKTRAPYRRFSRENVLSDYSNFAEQHATGAL